MNEQKTIEKSRFVSLRVKLLIGFTLLFTIVFAVAFYWFYNFATDRAVSRIQEDARDTMLAAAEGVDAEQFVALAQEGEPRDDGYSDDPRYWDHINWLATVHEIEPRAYVYTYVEGEEENQIFFIGSFGAALDPPEGAQFLEPFTSKGIMLQGLEETTFHSNFKPYQDKWGKWVTVYTPIRNDQGEPVGALGLDFRADYVYEVQQAIRNRVVLAFSVTYVALFVLVFFMSNGLTRPIISLTRIAERIGEGDYDQDLTRLMGGRFRDEIGTLAEVFSIMVSKVYKREQTLRRQVEALKIEIDEVKRRKQVDEIVESDFFRDLQAKADRMRSRRARLENESPEEPESPTDEAS